MEQLIGLGVSWVWMGLEGKKSHYAKLNNVNTHALVRRLQSNGIRVLGSSIIGLENHRPEDMPRIIEEAVSYGTDFHQFMLYTPNDGTTLHAQHKEAGCLLDESEFPPADAHGQYRFNYRHAHIPAGQEEHFLRQAFEQDFAVNGPSIARLVRTQLTGWLKYRRHPDRRIRKRFRREAKALGTTYTGAIWAIRSWYDRGHPMAAKMEKLLKELYKAFGLKARLFALVLGRYLNITMRREERRLANGWTYEPETHCEKTPAALTVESATVHALNQTAADDKCIGCKGQATDPSWIVGAPEPRSASIR
jgi:hypothetical protein